MKTRWHTFGSIKAFEILCYYIRANIKKRKGKEERQILDVKRSEK